MSEYIAWCPEYGEEKKHAKLFEASSGYAAAEKWAEWSDKADDCYIGEGRDTPTVFVQKEGDVIVHKFIVTGEMVRYYSARLIVDGK